MLVVMQQGATEEQIEHVIDRLVDLGFDVHRSTGLIHGTRQVTLVTSFFSSPAPRVPKMTRH